MSTSDEERDHVGDSERDSTWLTIEAHRGSGWEVLAEGKAPGDVSTEEIVATLASYCGNGEPHRALLNGRILVTTDPIIPEAG